jgi:hypothetical protein
MVLHTSGLLVATCLEAVNVRVRLLQAISRGMDFYAGNVSAS